MPEKPVNKGFLAHRRLFKLAKFYLIHSTYPMFQSQISSLLNCFVYIVSDAIESYCHFIVTNNN